MSARTLLNSSWDLKTFVTVEGHGVKGLSDMGLNYMPHEYIQPQSQRLDISKDVVTDHALPVIDMSKWNDDLTHVSESICNAAQKYGFFQIINHGVGFHLLENLMAVTHRFFELPAEEKKKYTKENSRSNRVRYGTSFTPESEKVLEWKDYLSLFYHSEDEASLLWPQVCKKEVLEYKKCTEIVARRLLQALMTRMNVKEANESLLMGSFRINLNYYPKCLNPELTVGVGPHSDISTITILLQDEIGGLYVRNTVNKDSCSWIQVPPVKGSLVVNIGDALEIMSNGLYKSVEHCVIANGARNRVSIPVFVNPSSSAVIGPLPEVLENGDAPLYRQVPYSEYVALFFRKGHDGKDTIEFAKA